MQRHFVGLGVQQGEIPANLILLSSRPVYGNRIGQGVTKEVGNEESPVFTAATEPRLAKRRTSDPVAVQ